MRVASGHHEGENRELHFVISLLPLLEQHGMDVAFEMIDRDQRLFEGEGKGLGVADANEKCSCKAWALGDRDGIDGVVGSPGFGKRLPHHWHNGAEMLARCKFG